MRTGLDLFDRRAPAERGLAPGRSWGAAAGTAAAVVLGEPRLWLLGTAGFVLRGGWLLLGLPIWAIPSPVGLSTLLGPDAFTAAGPGTDLVAKVFAGTLLIIGLVGLSALGAAWVELRAFERFVRDPETAALRGGRRAGQPAGGRARLVLELLGIEATAFLPAAFAIVAALAAMAGAIRDEYLFPTSYEVPLLARVAIGNAPLLLIAASLLLAGDLAAASTSRGLLAARFGLAERGGTLDATLRLVASRPGWLVRSAVAAWAATLVLVLPALAAVLIAWGGVRPHFLAPPPPSELGLVAGWAVVTVLFIALWLASILLGGLASAFRAALWSAASAD